MVPALNFNTLDMRIVWNQTTLKRTEYMNGKYYQSQTFGSREDLLDNKTNFERIQAKREAKGRRKVTTELA